MANVGGKQQLSNQMLGDILQFAQLEFPELLRV